MTMDELGFVYFRDRIGDTFRWKGENVSTAEVESIVMDILGFAEDVAVYGVSIPNTEGRAGMAAIHLISEYGGGGGDATDSLLLPQAVRLNSNRNVIEKELLDLDHLASELKRRLPPFAIPLFLRLLWSLADSTGTFKIKKAQLKEVGFDLSKIGAKDQIYFMDSRRNGDYVLLDDDQLHLIRNGDLRF